VTHRRCPLGNLPEVLSVLAFAVVVVYLALERRQRNKYSGMFLLGLVIPIMIVSSSSGPTLAEPSSLLKSPLFGLHTTMAILGYAAFLVSTVYGVMYLLLHKTLKARSFGLVFHRLPSLDGLASMAVGGALIGFFALTATIVVGMVWGAHALKPAQLPNGLWGDPKIALTLVVWVAYGLGLIARFVLRWANRPTMWLLVTAFVVAVLAMVALNTVLSTFHDFTTAT
jgi:ABC-type transport system involved in cytochrome c biogenesis permease subunit